VVQEEPRLNLILQPPKPQNEVLHIRKSQESEPGGASTLAKTSANEARPKTWRPAKVATRQLPMGASLSPAVAFAERNIFVNQYAELEIGEELRERLRRVASDERIDLVLPRALANAQGSRDPVRLLEQINRALSYARQDAAKITSRSRYDARPQAQRSAANEDARRKLEETYAELGRELDAEAHKRAQSTAGGNQCDLAINELVGRLDQAVHEGTLGGAHQAATQRRSASNVV